MIEFKELTKYPNLLGNDLVINEDACNLGCEYCLTGQSNMKESHGDQLIFQPPKKDIYEEGSKLKDYLHKIVDRVNEEKAPPLLKITGGEIFIIDGIMDFIDYIAPRQDILVIQTNGIPLNKDKISQLAKHKNIVIQISLDSTSYEGNQYRLKSEKLQERLLDRIAAVVEAGIPVEIYGVINDQSIYYLEDTVKWCDKFETNKPQLFPFPVRGPDTEKFKIDKEHLPYIKALADLKEKHPDVLPHSKFIERLISFYEDGERSWRCHLPRLVLSTFSDGIATPCPNIWFNNLGNIVEGDWKGTLEKVGETPFYELLLGERPRIDACKGCMTPWDTLSYYMEDEITLDELCEIPSYSSPLMREYLTDIKANYKEWENNGLKNAS
ncbi:MAG: radical SAM protein [Aestuariibacter sp.]